MAFVDGMNSLMSYTGSFLLQYKVSFKDTRIKEIVEDKMLSRIRMT